MADQLATAADLAKLVPGIDTDVATILIEGSTAAVQAAAGGQRIVEVIGDTVAIQGTTDRWLQLPQQPVSAVTSVILDGVTLSLDNGDYKLIGSRLWRACGWQTNWGWPVSWPFPVWDVNGAPFAWATVGGEPSVAIITYSHGYPAGHWRLQNARRCTLAIAAAAGPNPSSLKSETIDDYTYSVADALAATMAMDVPATMAVSLCKQYGRRAELVRVG